MIKKLILIALLGMGFVNAAMGQENLCAQDEVVAFSCPVGKKTVSLCTSPDFTESTGYVYYVFGTKKKIELSYPKTKINSQKYFISSHTKEKNSTSSEIYFNKKNTIYSIYYASNRRNKDEILIIPKTTMKTKIMKCTGFSEKSNLIKLESYFNAEEDKSNISIFDTPSEN